MSKKKKGNAIPTRFDESEQALINALADETGLAVSEIIRRCVKFSLLYAKENHSIDCILGNPKKIASILAESDLSHEMAPSTQPLSRKSKDTLK